MNVELAKRAVAAKGWRWMPGMLVASPDYHGDKGRVRYSLSYGREFLALDADSDPDDQVLAERCAPDLDDPATLGCLAFGLLHEAWGRADVSVCYYDGHWWVEASGDLLAKLEVFGEDQRGEALIAALEAAP